MPKQNPKFLCDLLQRHVHEIVQAFLPVGPLLFRKQTLKRFHYWLAAFVFQPGEDERMHY